MHWEIEEAGPRSAEWNMAIDSARLQRLSSAAQPMLRFYDWEQLAATYGYFLDPWSYFDQVEIEKNGLQLARRPTGGGVIFHMNDLAFAIVVPADHPFYALNSLDSYARINQCVLDAIQSLNLPLQGALLVPDLKENCSCRGGFCMANPTVYDILLEGRKVGGAAQRKTKKGLLHQGSICLDLPKEDFLQKILKDKGVVPAMQQASYALIQDGMNSNALKSKLKLALIKSITQPAAQ